MYRVRKGESSLGTLNSERVALRPIEKRDLKTLNGWKNDEDVYRFLGGGFAPTSIDIQENWMTSLMDMSGNNRRFMIEDNDSCPIGMIGLYEINWIHRTCELGIFIGDASARGKGLASEAYRLLESYASRYLNLRKIKAFVVKQNEPAVSMYCHLGFRVVGTLEKERFIDGRYCDLTLMEKFISLSFEGAE